MMNWGGRNILYVKLNLAQIHKEHSPVLIPNLIDWRGQLMREWATSRDLDHFRYHTAKCYTRKDIRNPLKGEPITLLNPNLIN